MKNYRTKIQRNKSINLSKSISDDNKEKGYDTVQWIIDKENITVNLKFLKCNKIQTQEYIVKENKIIFYRKIYGYSAIKIPVKVLEIFNCTIQDTIELKKHEKCYQVYSIKKHRMTELNGLINK